MKMDFEKAIMTLKEAVEKQIPKKPVILFDIIRQEYGCPECLHWVYETQQYCDKCGQALDWGDHPTEKGGERVMAEWISQDRAFCENRECTKTECDRHYSHIDWSIAPPWRSFAPFEGTKYCLKEKGGE